VYVYVSAEWFRAVRKRFVRHVATDRLATSVAHYPFAAVVTHAPHELTEHVQHSERRLV